MNNKKVAIVDGSNIAYLELSNNGSPKVSNLIAVRNELKQRGYDPVIIVDASLRHEIDDPGKLESMIDSQQVRQAPAGTDADYFIVKMAEEHKAAIVSNDRYNDYSHENPWLNDRRIPLMIVRGAVEIQE
jgi:hypothetical protein